MFLILIGHTIECCNFLSLGIDFTNNYCLYTQHYHFIFWEKTQILCNPVNYVQFHTAGVPNSVLHWLYNRRAVTSMSDTSHLPTNTNMSDAAAAPKAKKAAKPKVPAAHPPYGRFAWATARNGCRMTKSRFCLGCHFKTFRARWLKF